MSFIEGGGGGRDGEGGIKSCCYFGRSGANGRLGVMVEPTRFGTHVVFNTGLERTRPCRPQVFVHTMSYSGEVDDISPDDIEAMEVYTSIATVPAELQSARAQSCGAIVIWTREPPPKR